METSDTPVGVLVVGAYLLACVFALYVSFGVKEISSPATVTDVHWWFFLGIEIQILKSYERALLRRTKRFQLRP